MSLYWAMKMDAISLLCLVTMIITGAVAAFISLFSYIEGRQPMSNINRWLLPRTLLVCVISGLLLTFLPTTQEAMLLWNLNPRM